MLICDRLDGVRLPRASLQPLSEEVETFCPEIVAAQVKPRNLTALGLIEAVQDDLKLQGADLPLPQVQAAQVAVLVGSNSAPSNVHIGQENPKLFEIFSNQLLVVGAFRLVDGLEEVFALLDGSHVVF
jgi:hypothetical protein